MQHPRRNYRPVPRRVPQGSDNSGLYGTAALATLAGAGYLGYKHLTKDKTKPQAPVPVAPPAVPVAPPAEHTPSAWEEYTGGKGWGFNLPAAKEDIKNHGYGLADGSGTALAAGLGLGAASHGITAAAKANFKLGPQFLKQLKNPKSALAAALIAGGLATSDNSITGLRKLTLPNATLNPDYYAAGVSETLGVGAVGAGTGLYASNMFRGAGGMGPASRIDKALAAIGRRPGRAALAGAILGLTGGYLSTSFDKKRS